MFRVLAMNPGSTSTKIAVYEDEKLVFTETLRHSEAELTPFNKINDQYDFRRSVIESVLSKNKFKISDFDAFVGRGGLIKPIESGTYRVNEKMIQDLQHSPIGEHASNLGGLMAHAFENETGKPSYIVDPVVVDEMDDIAKVTGFPEIKRHSIFHALNHKAVARRAAKELNKNYNDINLIVVHLGGGISIGAHKKGKIVDVNNALNGDGPIAPERAGSIPTWDLIEFAKNTKLDEKGLRKRLAGNAGIVAHLKTNDMREVEDRVKNGDKHATFIYKAMAYSISKWIGGAAVVLNGDVEAIVITGGLAYDKDFIEWVKERVSFIADIIIYPGEDEMKALAMGAMRVLTNEEEAGEYI